MSSLTSQMRAHSTTVATVAALGVGASFVGIYLLRRRRNGACGPWEAAGRVERAFVYPLKSCKGVETSYLDCTERGPRNGWLVDREFVLIDEAHGNQLITARTYPAMVLIEADVLTSVLTVRFPPHDVGGASKSVIVDLGEVHRRNDVRKANTDGYDCGDEIAAAFCEYLGVEGRRQLRVLRFSAALFTERDMKSERDAWHSEPPQIQDHIAYADKSSYMINTSASVDDLNARLVADNFAPIDVRNFRPSFVVADAPAYDEDRWLDVRIGDAEFVCYVACSRCVLTNVNPDSGEKDANMQPLTKLRDYRLAPEGKMREFYGKSPLFGVHLSLKRAGRVRVGDTVFARCKPSPF